MHVFSGRANAVVRNGYGDVFHRRRLTVPVCHSIGSHGPMGNTFRALRLEKVVCRTLGETAEGANRAYGTRQGFGPAKLRG